MKDSLDNLENAVANLERAVVIPNDRELVVEGTIQRFETVVELLWKTLKRALESEGFEPKTPKETLKIAFRAEWLHDEALWLDLLERRSTTSHQYLSEELAVDNYEDIKRVTPLLREAFDLLRSRYQT